MQQNFLLMKQFSTLILLGLLSGCACDFLGMEHVAESKTPFEKRIDEEKRLNPFEQGGESDSSTAGNLKTVYFDYKAVKLNPDQIKILDENIEELIRNPGVSIVLSAHSDQIGGIRYNKKLSEARASYVIRYMTAKGIIPDRLSILIKGPTEPVVSDNSDQITTYSQILEYKKEFNKNRRINFIIR